MGLRALGLVFPGSDVFEDPLFETFGMFDNEVFDFEKVFDAFGELCEGVFARFVTSFESDGDRRLVFDVFPVFFDEARNIDGLA